MASRPLTKEQFLSRCAELHGDKYLYPCLDDLATRNKITIICKEHGPFEQRVGAHLSGQGCRLCRNLGVGKRFLFTKEQFIDGLDEWKKTNLDFTKFDYITDKIKGEVVCKIHNESFMITPGNLRKSKRGCPKCSRVYHAEQVRNTKEDFINLCITKHGDIFDYSLVPDSFHSHDHITIKCKECDGCFERLAYAHCNIGHSCPKCTATKIHKFIEKFLNTRNVDFISNDRKVLGGKELDLYIPSKNIAIECNGNYWHSEELVGSEDYHLHKTKLCENLGIQLFHFFEDELLFKSDIVESILEQKLQICNNKIYARQCDIREVPIEVKNTFLNNNHIQGEDQSRVKLGLYFQDTLVSLMTFGHPRYNKNVQWELIRFCNIKNTTVVGAASKLLSHFEKTYNPESIISYADKRISNGGVYKSLNFEYSHDSDPRYFYFHKKNPLIRYHRSNFTKDKILSKFPNTDISKTEKEIMQELGYKRIWDCGTKAFIKRY